MAEINPLTVGEMIALLSDKPLDMPLMFAFDGYPSPHDDGNPHSWGMQSLPSKPIVEIVPCVKGKQIAFPRAHYGVADSQAVGIFSTRWGRRP